ncbi:CesT family type III secretion system chaperone [Pseudomonas savastanoi]|uniref:CesT family type III secretion system chaperone n=1 Tax=Pseudomonas savastanoi TaxID=29438 RepID=UPI000F009574|nr:CesT family type III secretion system chaperone [Pseudomonas savastanoi]RMM62890.1 hypothetical protein ALQ75_200037 [Pseudomonas savastanoi pv. glycinea]RMM96786.1 hypothetical protein ALQ68_200064 [Pseudomonas savastanoi pv. glycinea]RMQ04278.1 hypothetical protein ALQ13_02575 [Pseudomonas savastanoi pv. glycinea]RMQ85247.1 hypothetical protein ALP96_200117 [Pseudomonas savastanoi pv. glycinea]RMR00565.1 hypothetical protein ALP95_200145 [Pseudomonas savastanoi pv. glycinea]
MRTDETQPTLSRVAELPALQNAPGPARRKNATAGQEGQANGPPAIPAYSAPWLAKAATVLGRPADAVRMFSRSGLLTLEHIRLMMFCQELSPPRWSVLGYPIIPPGVPAGLWHEALLRANTVAMAVQTCTFALDEQGTAVLITQIPFHAYGDAQALAQALTDMDELASGLATTVSAAAHVGSVGHSPPSPDMAPASPDLAQLSSRVEALATEQMGEQWHRPLLEQALPELGLPVPKAMFGSVGAFKLGKRFVELIAAPDQKSLLLSTPVSVQLKTLPQRRAALQTSFYLLTGAHCSIALAPNGASLQSRWDATGLDGKDLAAWLADFVTLAISLDRGDNAATSASGISNTEFKR